MKYTNIHRSLDFGLLRFVRDSRPTELELLDWLGPAQQGRYYLLRKAGLLVLQEDKVMLSPQHLSSDGKYFRWEIRGYNIDEETIDIYRTEKPKQVDAHFDAAIETA